MNDEAQIVINELWNDCAKKRRIIRQSKEMLIDALTALEKGKAHITKDHLERVISYLSNVDN